MARLSRRSLAGAAMAMVGTMPIAAGANPDAALMSAIAHFHSCHAEVLRIEADKDHRWEDVEVAGDAWDEAAGALCDLTPVTRAGLAAKARAVAMTLRACVGDYTRPERFEANAETHERLAMAFTEDVLAMA